MIERTTVRLPKELLSKARKKAQAEGRTLTSLIEDGLREIVMEPPAARPKRVYPRLSTAVGGARPGIDISDGSALQEMDDLEYIERLKNGFK